MRIREILLEATVALAAVLLCLSKPTDKRSVLLPPSLLPEHYEISLAPQLDKGVFHGVVVISGIAIANTDKIVLHCKSLLFNTTSLTDLTTDEELEVENIQEDLLLQQCHLLLNQSLQRDHEYRLSVQFMGVVGKEGIGLYGDFYVEGGERHRVMLTHFQPNFARSVFPCFDEPHYKAQFLLRVDRGNFPTVISNMPISTSGHSDPEEDSRGWVEFEETPPMSPYLLVLVMCDYLALTDSSTNTSVWAPRSRLHEAQLALNVSVSVLEQCERYFGTEYMLPKLDHIPVSTLNSVAMESWGAITYKKDFLLWEEGVSTWLQKEMISAVICHEIIHQWLGNLVTTAWWNTTWLNEGVTSFYHYYIIDKIEPSWNVMDTTFVTQILLILNEEAGKDTKPLTINEPFSQEAISSIAFSPSVYLKGAAIIRMVFNLMPPDIFREAMVQYVLDNEYGSVDEQDLWQGLAAIADLPVDLEAVMYSWTHQPGYPLVTVLRDGHGCISVKQTKYLSKDESDVRWTIPLTYTTSSELDFNSTNTVWFPEDREEMRLEVCLEPDDWIILNIRLSGFYRVNYDPTTWRALTKDLLHCDLSDIDPVNRGQLLHDGFDLARHQLLEYPVVLELSRYLARETEFLPWAVAIQWFSFLRARVYQTEALIPFQTYVLSLVDGVFLDMPLSGEAGGMRQEIHRKQIVEFACLMGHTRCLKEATDTVYLLMSGVHVKVPLDLKPALLCTAVRHGQDEVWHFVLKEYLGATENESWKYLLALACSSKREAVERLLKDVADPKSFVRSTEERLTLLMEVGRQDDSLEPVLDMIISKFHLLAANFDIEVILQLLKTFLSPVLSVEERKKITDISILVSKTQSTKQIELMEAMINEVNSLDSESLYEDARKWFIQEAQDEEASDSSTPTPMEPDLSTTTANESQAVEATISSTVADYSGEEAVEKEDGEEEWEDVTETDDFVPTETPGGHSTQNTATFVSVVLAMFLCFSVR